MSRPPGFPTGPTTPAAGSICPPSIIPAHKPLLDPSDARANVGGYDDYPELYTRWFQYATFLPIFRTHGSRPANEVWSYGKQAEPILEKYLRLRYQLMPYIYSLGYRTWLTGAPFMRNLDLLLLEVVLPGQLQPKEIEVQNTNGHWYLVRIRPYVTLEKKVQGIMMLMSVDDIKRARDYAESIVQTVHQPIVILDDNLYVKAANRLSSRLSK